MKPLLPQSLSLTAADLSISARTYDSWRARTAYMYADERDAEIMLKRALAEESA